MSPEALLLCGGIGSLLVSAIVWGTKGYIGALNQRADEWKALADRGNGQTREALEIAKGRR